METFRGKVHLPGADTIHFKTVELDKNAVTLYTIAIKQLVIKAENETSKIPARPREPGKV